MIGHEDGADVYLSKTARARAFVIPEVPLGTLTIVFAYLAALGIMSLRKNYHNPSS